MVEWRQLSRADYSVTVLENGRLARLGVPLLLVLLILAALLRVGATYRVFNQTWDEPAHVAAGLEWLQRGAYTFESLHPPLARVMTAVGPFLAGARLTPDDPNPWSQANRILGSGEAYEHMLALARAGVLPFLVLACAGVYLVARRAAGPAGGVIAVLLFSTLPPVLAHAGLATTDFALAAGTILTFQAFLWWRESRTTRRGVVLGLAIGATVLTKFSSLLMLPVGFAAVLIAERLIDRPRAHGPPGGVRALRPVWITALLAIWVGYRFSIGPILPPGGAPAHPPGAGDHPVVSFAARIAELAVYPAPALLAGLVSYAGESSRGRKAYFMGQRGRDGWWLFFPTVIALKTPIPFLALAGCGFVVIAGRSGNGRRRVGLAAALAALGIVLVLLPSRVNIGLRHALPVYPLLAVVAGCGLCAIWRRGRHHIGAAIGSALVVWHVAVSVRAAPDFLPYFNELASGPPERYVVDSDLDWGQDLKRLADTLRARNIPSVALAYNGSADPHALGIEYRILHPFMPDTGWIAISVFTQKLGYWNQPTSDDFAWLERYRPVARAGRSMLLYRIPAANR